MSWQSRQSFLSPNSDAILRKIRVAAIGLGGGGSHIVQQLAHVGVGKFVLCDPDVYEDTNHNRTVGGLSADIAEQTAKVQIAERVIRGINPEAKVQPFPNRWQDVAPTLRACDVIFGCVDSYTERDQLENLSRRFLIPYLDIGMDLHEIGSNLAMHGQVILSLPGSLCMRCFNFIRPDLLAREAQQYGHAGGRPQVIWPNGVLASTAVGLFMQLVFSWNAQIKPGSLMYDYDGNRQTVILSPRVNALAGASCPHFGQLVDTGDPLWRPEMQGQVRRQLESAWGLSSASI